MSESRNETFQLRINPFLRVDLGNTHPARLLLVASLVAALAGQVCLAEDWLQWGGPNRDFKVSSPGLAESWPEEGPPRLWSRPLGEGYSAIVAENGVLYTMYRGSDPEALEKETVIALDADTGRTKWEYRYDAPFPEKMNRRYGPGPISTPLITGARLFTIGSTGKLHGLEKETGKLLWARDIYTEFAMQTVGMKTNRGYSSSPIAYEDTLILP
ncbi:MAG: PQQ-binding-like beta-propeller repeat protein, partial [Candidatus Acidoferrales bacterium]